MVLLDQHAVVCARVGVLDSTDDQRVAKEGEPVQHHAKISA